MGKDKLEQLEKELLEQSNNSNNDSNKELKDKLHKAETLIVYMKNAMADAHRNACYMLNGNYSNTTGVNNPAFNIMSKLEIYIDPETVEGNKDMYVIKEENEDSDFLTLIQSEDIITEVININFGQNVQFDIPYENIRGMYDCIKLNHASGFYNELNQFMFHGSNVDENFSNNIFSDIYSRIKK